MEHVAVARLAAQLVGIAAGVEEQRAVALRDLRDRKPRRRADLADDRNHLVALDQPRGLRRCGLRVDAVLGDQLDLAAHHATGGVDFLDGKLDPHHRVLAERSQESGERRQVTDADRVRLAAADRGKSQCAERRGSGTALHQAAAYAADRLTHGPFLPGVDAALRRRPRQTAQL